MARIGLSKPYAAVYAVSGGTVSYTSGKLCGKAISLELSLEGGNDNILYADNAPCESDTQFAGGSLTIGTDDLYADVMKTFLGMPEESITTTGFTNFTTASPKWYKNNDDQVVPYLGFGAIAKKKIGGAIKYVAIIFNKIQFANLAQSMETQGDTVSWQTESIEATVMRDDSTKHDWRWISSDLDTEADAETLIKDALDIA
jgi:hypothetical protein